MKTYYDVTLGKKIKAGSDILNKPAEIVFTYPNGTHSNFNYPFFVLAWVTDDCVRLSSTVMNVETAWQGANGGTLTIDTGSGNLTFPVKNFTNHGSGTLVRPAFRNAAGGAAGADSSDTVLDQVISDIPWQDNFEIGAGVNAVTGSVTGSALKSAVLKPSQVKKSVEHYRFVQEESDLDREIEASTSGKYNIEGVTVTGSASYLSQVQFSDLSITLVASYESSNEGYDEPDGFQLTDAAKKLMASDPKGFRDHYGDYFVAGARRQSSFLAIYVCKSKTMSNLDQFKASLGVEAPEVFSQEGSARFKSAASQSSIDIAVDLYMNGFSGTPPAGAPWSPDSILKALDWFKANEQGVPSRAKLEHYSALDPSYPVTIPVAPAAFVELRTLYSDVWAIRSKYASCPGVYRDSFKKDFQALDNGVVANQSNLASDSQMLRDYQNQADQLGQKLEQVFARMDFYFKVKAAISQEPDRGSSNEENDGGQQVWSYGFESYPQSPAVNIHSQTQNYKNDWEVGHQSHSFQFGPDNNCLIVGWKVQSNWGDGTNGSWAKASGTILLSNNSSISVTSNYDRGLDWSVTIDYVDAKDYQFG